MSTRTLKFKFLNVTGVFSLESDARTYGELKAEIRQNQDLFKLFGTKTFEDINLIDRDTRVIYKMDEAILPATDAILFVSVTKSKGGTIITPTSYDEIELLETMTYNELRSLGSTLNHTENADLSLTGTKEELLDRLSLYFEEKFEDDQEEPNSLRETLLDMADRLTDLADSIVETSYRGCGNVIIKVTDEDLNSEMQDISRKV
jgi:hypothetical protein